MHWFHWWRKHPHRRRHHHPHKHPRRTIWLIVNGFAVELKPYLEIEMTQVLRVNEIDNLSIAYLDSAGNPVTAAFDAAPSWSLGDPGTSGAALTVGGDGLTAVLNPGAVGGTVTVGVTGLISGTSYTASLDVTFEAAPTVVASIRIDAVPAPKP